jgi:hypothetical protein
MCLFDSVLQFTIYAVKKHSDRSADDFEVAEFLRRDIHEQIVIVRIAMAATEGLDEVLHRGFQLAVSSAELFEEQTSEPGIRA